MFAELGYVILPLSSNYDMIKKKKKKYSFYFLIFDLYVTI